MLLKVMTKSDSNIHILDAMAVEPGELDGATNLVPHNPIVIDTSGESEEISVFTRELRR